MTGLKQALTAARAEMVTISTTLTAAATGAEGPTAFAMTALLRSLQGAIDWAEALEHSPRVRQEEPGE